MITYPHIDPVALSIGPLQFRWYGLMYLFAFAAGWLLAVIRIRKPDSGWKQEEFDDLATWVILGIILGARLGHVIFYDLLYYLHDPLEIFKIWNGGMSFHGGLLGVLTAVYFHGRKYKRHFLEITDFVVPLVPTGLFFGRMGNFINGELWGRVSDVPWAMVFPHAGHLPRHPSQLYEAFLEGLLLFAVLWIYSGKKRDLGKVSGVFALGYGIMRFCVEFVREPETSFAAFGWMTTGQALCLPMILLGLWLLFFRARAGRQK